MMRPRYLLVLAGTGLLGLATTAACLTGPSEKHLSADFANTINLYPGAQVKVLGVPVGSVTEVSVRGTQVHVEMTYDDTYPLPTGVHAAIVPPSIVGDRFVQLTPAYTGGSELPDHAHLGTDHTQVPIELDQTYQGLNDLASALGPSGANAHGALSGLLTATAANLGGNGNALHTTIQQLSAAVDTVDTSRQDIVGTVTNLGAITGTLAGDDGQVRELVNNLAAVSTQLNGQRDQLRSATNNLGEALAEVANFVQDNRDSLTTNIAGLRQVTATLRNHQKDLVQTLDTAPLGVSNLVNLAFPANYDPTKPDGVNPIARTTVVTARAGGIFQNLPNQLGYSLTALCGQMPAAQRQQLSSACAALQGAGGDLGQVLLQAARPALGTGTGTGGPSLPLAKLLLGGSR